MKESIPNTFPRAAKTVALVAITLAAGGASMANARQEQQDVAPAYPQHPGLDHTAGKDMTVVATDMLELADSNSPDVSYTHFNLPGNDSELKITVSDGAAGTEDGFSSETMSFSGPDVSDNGFGLPNPDDVLNMTLQTDKFMPEVSKSRKTEDIRNSLSFAEETNGHGLFFQGLYNTNGLKELTGITALTEPVARESYLNGYRLHLVYDQAKKIIGLAQDMQPAGEMHLPFHTRNEITIATKP
jgi:hypothetical protein